MKSLIFLWFRLAEELASRCCTSATMDCKTVQGRFKHEGSSFLTITLTNYAKDFERSLDAGCVDRNLFAGFGWQAGLPRFLGGFLDQVFDRSSGYLLDDPSIEAIYSIRQLTLVFGKILLPCSDARVANAFDAFVQCEYDVRDNNASIAAVDWADYERVAGLLFGSVFDAVDWKVFDRELRPKHGPGATADGLRGNAKFKQREWPARLQEILPWEEFLLPNLSFVSEIGDVDIIEPGSERPVRVIAVPKTLKTPRIIAIEPTCMQYMQQAVSDAILVEVKKINHLRHFLDPTDQTPNQRMAQLGSENGSLATLDLSEASDRVSNLHVQHLLGDRAPHLAWALDATRSRKADVPGHGVIPLAKYASMGSGLTFTMEAMVFLTIVFVGIERSLGRPLDPAEVSSFVGKVRVYGDDIIVPVDHVESVARTLDAFGAVVNVNKSFWAGKFRESCGKEYYDGQDVSIVRVRRVFPSHRTDVDGTISLVSLRNQLYKAGCWRTCAWLDEEIRKLLKWFPVIQDSSPLLGRHSFLGYEAERMDKNLHSPLVKGWMVRSAIPQNSVDGVDALLKHLIKRGDLPVADKRHLSHSGRPRAVDIKLGWASPF